MNAFDEVFPNAPNGLLLSLIIAFLKKNDFEFTAAISLEGGKSRRLMLSALSSGNMDELRKLMV